MDLQESMIEDVLAGKFNAKKAAAAQPNRSAMQTKASELSHAATAAIEAKDWAKAESSIAELEKTLPKTQNFLPGSLRIALLLGQGDQDAAVKLAEKLAGEHSSNAMVQNMFAARLARATDPKPVVLDAAERIATQANEASDGKDVTSLVTLARIAFLKGNRPKQSNCRLKSSNSPRRD